MYRDGQQVEQVAMSVNIEMGCQPDGIEVRTLK